MWLGYRPSSADGDMVRHLARADSPEKGGRRGREREGERKIVSEGEGKRDEGMGERMIVSGGEGKRDEGMGERKIASEGEGKRDEERDGGKEGWGIKRKLADSWNQPTYVFVA